MGEILEDGWQASTPETDTLLRAYVVGWAGWVTELASALGARALVDDDVVALDAGSDFFLANGAILLHPQDPGSLRATVARLRDFYASGPGGPWIVMSPWPTPPLGDLGCGLVGHPPFMVRPPGGTPPPDPVGLEIVETHDAGTQADWAQALGEGYPAPGADLLADPAAQSVAGTRFFVGYLDGQPVACSAAHTTDACNHVEWVANVGAARGRGIGAALTWRATLADPTKPSLLLASDPGQPVYERMGYLRVSRFTLWTSGRDRP